MRQVLGLVLSDQQDGLENPKKQEAKALQRWKDIGLLRQDEQGAWQLVEQLTDPLLQMGREYTSPAIERSVLLRMGFSSLEAKAIADWCQDRGLMPHGCGHVVYKLSQAQGLPLREAGLALAEGRLRDEAESLFREAHT